MSHVVYPPPIFSSDPTSDLNEARIRVWCWRQRINDANRGSYNIGKALTGFKQSVYDLRELTAKYEDKLYG